MMFLFGPFFGHFAEWLSPTESETWIPERVAFPILVGLNVVAACSLVSTLALRVDRG
jgi:hypothetical protein